MALIWTLLGGLLGLFLLLLAYMSAYQRWETRRCSGNAYFGATPARRSAIRTTIAYHALILRPFVTLLSRLLPASRQIALERVDNVAFPAGVCTADSVAAARQFQPAAADVFVVTPMKCGTTWMQQLVLEILQQGRGNIHDCGHLQASSAWLEAVSGVPLEQAPGFGDSGSRVIKSHLPAGLCPLDPAARYIYVSRDPISCFASVRDYLTLLYGPFCPDPSQLLDWYLSDDMFFSAWPQHTESWLEAARVNRNVLLVSYEEMLADLPAAALRVAAHLQVSLDAQALARVCEHASFEYMKTNEAYFEMNPPNLFTESSAGSFFTAGGRQRERSVSAAEQARITEFCSAAAARLQEYRRHG